jgi:23S rRNA pseudouridine2605 synthase
MTEGTFHRLNKHLALALGISRREADLLIEQGSVLVNDKAATLGARFSDGDTIRVKGKLLENETTKRYIAFHKPPSYVCSRKAQGDTPTIYSLLPAELQDLKTVGRLDKDSSGLILLTNDGDFAFAMTHPKFYKVKVYEVELDSNLEPLHQQMISDYGVQLEDGPSKLQLQRLSDTERKTWQVTMSEGRNRQIRRTFASLGYTVTKLHRIQFGAYSLGDLKSGEERSFSL